MLSVSNIVNRANNSLCCVSNQPTLKCIAELSGIVNALCNGSISSTSSFSTLPSAGLNKGRMIFLNSENFYVYSDGVQWSNNFCTVSSATSSLWMWGANSAHYQLGDGTQINKCSPVREFCSATDWSQVSAGLCTSFGLKTSGQLWGWGNNGFGQVGIGNTIFAISYPTREFCSASDWCYVSAGKANVSAIKTNGQIWVWGCNNFGTLGDGTSDDRCSPVREFCSATDWCYVSTGYNNVAIKTNGQLWSWGLNLGGRLGIGDSATIGRCSPVREFCSATDWCQADTFLNHTAAVKTTGQLWTWGCNNQGQLGIGTVTGSCSPVREFCSATDWCQVSVGFCHTMGLKFSGELWVWGNNGCAQLGVGDTGTSRCSPIREFCSATDWCQISAGRLHSMALKTNGQLWVWGFNTACATLGDGTTDTRCSPVREFCSATDWCQISAGGFHSGAVKRSRGFNAI
jgi:alpha-tubulin suppressor-like RCC1 family protein